MRPPVLAPRHAEALVEILRALSPEYRAGLRWPAQLYHALFGVPALLQRPRPSLRAAHAAAGAEVLQDLTGQLPAGVPSATDTPSPTGGPRAR